MSQPENVNNPILKQSQEHKIILNYVARFDQALMDNKKEELVAMIRTISSFFQKDLKNHFKMEEKIFFPAVILGNGSEESVTMILELQKDHGMMEKEMERILDVVQLGKTHSANVDKPLLELFEPFLHDIKDHARREVEELFPLIDTSDECKALVAKFSEGI